MHIQINIDIQNADTKALATALQLAKLASNEQDRLDKKKLPAELPQAVHITAPLLQPMEPAADPEPAAQPEPEPIAAPEPEAPAQAAPEPEPETPAEPAPEPEPEPAATADGMTLDALRKRFTAISKEYPGARKKVSEILVEGGALSLPTLA